MSKGIINLLQLYPRDMNIYGDWGNTLVLKKRLERLALAAGLRGGVLHLVDRGDGGHHALGLEQRASLDRAKGQRHNGA